MNFKFSMQQMFAVDPVDNCPHCEELDATKFADKRFDQKCHSCNNIGENWICLSCQEICCSRYVNSHMVSHNKETNHPIALSFADLSFWCYGCDTYVKSHKFTTVHDQFYDQKFGDLRRDDIEGIITRMAEVNLNKDEENVDNTQSKENNEEAKKVPEEAKVVPDEAKGAQKDSETESSTKDDVTIKEDEKDEVKDDEDDGKFTREKLIKKLKNGEYKKITVLTGAGISVSAGIPDFRSPKIGLYATLKEKYDMDDPAEIFSLQKFFDSPELFYDFAKEFDWSKYDPTPTHYFISFLHHKGLLDMNFTQNIDCLELKAGIPESKLIAAHGNLAGVECPKCRTSYSMDIFKSHVDAGTI